MRYKVDENNYITGVYFNCYIGTCAEYTGTIPDGYTSLEEWASNAHIEAYKVVDGNLVYDSVRDAELQEQWAREEASITPEHSYYIVTTENISTIPLSQYNDGDVVDVYINGFRLIKGLHFSISENNIVLTKEVDVVGTEIEIVIKKYK
jgi:hypothetical protein